MQTSLLFLERRQRFASTPKDGGFVSSFTRREASSTDPGVHVVVVVPSWSQRRYGLVQIEQIKEKFHSQLEQANAIERGLGQISRETVVVREDGRGTADSSSSVNGELLEVFDEHERKGDDGPFESRKEQTTRGRNRESGPGSIGQVGGPKVSRFGGGGNRRPQDEVEGETLCRNERVVHVVCSDPILKPFRRQRISTEMEGRGEERERERGRERGEERKEGRCQGG